MIECNLKFQIGDIVIDVTSEEEKTISNRIYDEVSNEWMYKVEGIDIPYDKEFIEKYCKLKKGTKNRKYKFINDTGGGDKEIISEHRSKKEAEEAMIKYISAEEWEYWIEDYVDECIVPLGIDDTNIISKRDFVSKWLKEQDYNIMDSYYIE